MMKRIKQICASFLAVMMVVTYMPAMAFAESSGIDWAPDHKTFVYNGKSYEADVEKVEPTCTEAGYTIYTASAEGVEETYKEAGDPALGHDLGEAKDVIDIEATCTAEGSKHTEAKCQRKGCDYVEKSDAIVIPKVSHEPTDKPTIEKEKTASCSEEGSYDEVYYCKFDCGTELSRETKTTPKTDHEWVLDEEKSVKATCDKEGVNVYKCANCDETKEEVAKMLKHTPAEAVQENVVDPTCTEQGSYDSVVYCKDCNEELSRDVVVTNALGHKPDPKDEGTVKKEATCDEAGIIAFKCTVCGEDVEKAIPATGHTEGEPVEFVKAEPTCTEAGEKVVTVSCTVCGKELSHKEGVEIPATGHKWSKEAAKVTKEPTCTEEGLGVFVCTVCGEEKEEAIPATGHTKAEPVKEKIVDATCEVEGSYDEVVYCDVCGAEISRETKTVPALGHDWVKDEKASVKAECGKAGKDVFNCSRCEETKEEVLEALEHNYVKDEDFSREATCAEDGAFVEVCSLCGDVHRETVSKETVAHTLKKVEAVDATCQADGNKEYYECEVCHKLFTLIPAESENDEDTYVETTKEEVTIAKDPEAHVWDEGTVTKEAKCSKENEGKDGTEGEMTYKCTVKGCKETKTEVIPVPEHVFKTKVTKEATCEEAGDSYGICENCGYVTAHIEIPATGHKYGEKAVSAKVYWSETAEGEGSVEYTYVCENDAEHKKVEVEKFPAEGETIASEITKDPACGVTGEKTYTYTSAELADGSTVTDTKAYVVPALEHEPGTVVKENEVDATCTEDGSYEAVVYCMHCGKDHEFSRNQVKIEALGHDWADAVVENEVNKPGSEGYNDTKPYEYDLVKHCTRCDETEVVKHESVAAAGHNPAEAVKENEVEPTCTEKGSYDLVIYCKDDGEEIARTTVVVDAIGHNLELVTVDSTPATCTEDGEIVQGYVCTVCGEEIQDKDHVRTTEVVKAQGHRAEYTKQNILYKEATATEDGYYADVTYCGICGEEISVIEREAIPAANVATKAAALKAAAEAVDPSAYPADQQEAVAAAKAALAEAAANPDATAKDLDAAEEAFNKAMEAPNAAKAEADAAKAAADEAKAAADEAKAAADKAAADAEAAKAAADKAAADAAAAEAGTQDAVDKAAAAKDAADAAKAAADAEKAAADEAAAKAEAAKEAAEKAYGADSDEAKAAAAAAEVAKTAATAAAEKATAAAEAATKADEAKTAADTAKADADKKAEEDAAAKAAADEAKADADKAAADAEAAKAAADKAAADAAAAEAGTQDAVDKAAAAKAAADAAKAAADEAAAKADAAKEAAEKAYGADSDEAKAAGAAADAAKTAATAAAEAATKADEAKTAADTAKADADKKAEEAAAAQAAEEAKKAADEATKAAAAVTAAKYTDDSVKAVADAKAALDEAVKGGDSAKISEAAAKLSAAAKDAKMKAKNTIKVKAKTVKAKKAKKTTIKAKKAFKVTKAKGKVTYKKVKGNKKITVKSNGKVVVKKGLKKGKTYKIKVKVTAAGNGKTLAGSKTVTLKVKIK